VELAKRARRTPSRAGEDAFDAFGRGGSTLIAAGQMGRPASLMKTDALDCGCMIQEWVKLTGRTVERISVGASGTAAPAENRATIRRRLS